MILVSSGAASRWARSANTASLRCRTSTSSAMVSTVSRIQSRRRISSAPGGAPGVGERKRGEAPRQLGHDARALVRAKSDPARDFGEIAPAADTKRRDRVDYAHLVAGALDVGHESSRRCAGKIRPGTRKAIARRAGGPEAPAAAGRIFVASVGDRAA